MLSLVAVRSVPLSFAATFISAGEQRCSNVEEGCNSPLGILVTLRLASLITLVAADLSVDESVTSTTFEKRA